MIEYLEGILDLSSGALSSEAGIVFCLVFVASLSFALIKIFFRILEVIFGRD